MKRFYVLSDQHFGSLKHSHPENVTHWRRLVSFLSKQSEISLFILGDFFDFWISYKELIRTEYVPLLEGFKELSDAGVAVYYIRGNHDFMDMSLLKERYGVHIIDNEFYMEFFGKKIRMEHGDRIRYSFKHTIINRILWSPVLQALYKLFPADWAIALALRVAHSSRVRNMRKYQDKEMSQKYTSLLEVRDCNSGIDLTIIGHVHFADIVKGKSGWIYANSGSWLKAPTLLEVTPKTVSLKEIDQNGVPSKVMLQQILS